MLRRSGYLIAWLIHKGHFRLGNFRRICETEKNIFEPRFHPSKNTIKIDPSSLHPSKMLCKNQPSNLPSNLGQNSCQYYVYLSLNLNLLYIHKLYTSTDIVVHRFSAYGVRERECVNRPQNIPDSSSVALLVNDR